MKVTLKERTLKSGVRTLYLEIYKKGGKRSYESLNLFLVPEFQKKTDYRMRTLLRMLSN